MKRNLLKAASVIFFFTQIFLKTDLRGQTEQPEDYFETPAWRQAMGGSSIGRPVAQVESVVIATDGGNLRSYSSRGTALWNYYARGRLTPHISRSREGTSYLCRTSGLLIAVNRAGRELWQINLGTPIISPVLTGWDGRLFVFTEKKITCMTAAGYTLWSTALEYGTAIAPVRDSEGGIILVQENGEIIKFDPFGNVFSYSSESVPLAAASMNIDGWGHTILLLYEDRHMEVIYSSLGISESFRGRLDLPAVPVAAAGRNGEAAVLLQNGDVVLVEIEDKKILWTGQSHIRAGELPERAGLHDVDIFYDERGVYVITKTGAAGFAPDGRRLWITRLRGAAAIPSFGDDGILYSGGADWILYGYRLEDRVKAQQRMLYGLAPEGSYGSLYPRPSSMIDDYFRFDENEIRARFEEIREAIRGGAVGASEKEYSAWLMETAGSAMSNTGTGNRPSVHTANRAEAANLLAYLGSRETIAFLSELFTKDPEVIVKAAAAAAIGKIGVDPEGLAMAAFERAVLPPLALRDEAALTAVAAAAGALCRFSGPPLSDAGVRLLTMLSASNLPSSVRNRAQREIRSL